MTEYVKYHTVSGKEVADLMDAMTAGVAHAAFENVRLAAITLAVTLERPDIELTRLVDVVKNISEYMSLCVSSTDADQKVN